MADADDQLLGKVLLGRYRTIRALARGGMGVVYLGRTEGAAGFARPVVIKRILPEMTKDPNMTKMFVREARILANLQHPGIVGVVDFGEEDSAYVMVLEYVHGYDLGNWNKYLRQQRQLMPPSFAIHIVARLLEALHHAHTLKRPDGLDMQIVHRDVSPGNVLLDAEGHVKLLDFGIARMANEAGEYKTQQGTFKGKLSYAAPEVLGGKEASPQSDLYSCGVVLYQLLAGENPFRGKGMPETVNRVLNLMPPPIGDRRNDTEPGLDRVLAKALAKTTDERYQTAGEFAAALRALMTESENDVSAALAQAVAKDFNGDMAASLGLEPLNERDLAWREAQGAPPGRADQFSLAPPPLPGRSRSSNPTAVVARRSSGALSPVPEDRVTRHPTRRTPRPRSGLPGIAVGSLLAVGGGVAAFLAMRPAPSTEQTFLVVERPEANAAAPASAPTPPPDPAPASASDGPAKTQPERATDDTAANDTATTGSTQTIDLPEDVTASVDPAAANNDGEPGASASAKPAPKTVAAPAPPKKPNPSELSATFARRQGQVRSCFSSNPQIVEQNPQISVRFKVNTAGHVESASMVPAALNATPLGSCVLSVARGTAFGRLTEGVTFSIPIHAKRVE